MYHSCNPILTTGLSPIIILCVYLVKQKGNVTPKREHCEFMHLYLLVHMYIGLLKMI